MSPLSVAQAADETPDRLALIGDGPPLTYAGLAEAARARVLPDGPIVLCPRADRESVLDLLAALDTGRPLALLHPRWTNAERADARARFVRCARPGEVVVFTSGSSGRPKGVRLSQNALVAAAEAHRRALPFEEADRWLLTLPLAHVGGLSVITRSLDARSCIALAPGRVLRSGIVDTQTTLLSVVPTMMERLLSEPSVPSLRAILLGGAAASPSLIARARAAGWPVLPTYGASETCGQACTQRLNDLRPAGVGPAMPSVHVRTTPDAAIEITGPTLMAGYLDDPSPFENGWFRTGDLGEFDRDGHLHVRGRRDAVLITGGENVDPVEVEMALETHPDIERAFVTGLPDVTWGQRVVALIEGESDIGVLRRHLGDRVAGFKHPRAVASVERLPELASGKIDRRGAHALAAQLLLIHADST
ncbi:MAG: class I adenylate-forming enzyme family protein [Sandaracinaceae bacterium]